MFAKQHLQPQQFPSLSRSSYPHKHSLSSTSSDEDVAAFSSRMLTPVSQVAELDVDHIPTMEYSATTPAEQAVMLDTTQGIFFLQGRIAALKSRKEALELQMEQYKEQLFNSETKLNSILQHNRALTLRIQEVESQSAAATQEAKMALEEKELMQKQLAKVEQREDHLLQQVDYWKDLNQQYLESLNQRTEQHTLEQKTISSTVHELQGFSRLQSDQLQETLKQIESAVQQLHIVDGSKIEKPMVHVTLRSFRLQKNLLGEVRQYCSLFGDHVNSMNDAIAVIRDELMQENTMFENMLAHYDLLRNECAALRQANHSLELQLKHNKEVLQAKLDLSMPYGKATETKRIVEDLLMIEVADLKQKASTMEKEVLDARVKYEVAAKLNEDLKEQLNQRAVHTEEAIKGKYDSVIAQMEKQIEIAKVKCTELDQQLQLSQQEVHAAQQQAHITQQQIAAVKQALQQAEQQLQASQQQVQTSKQQVQICQQKIVQHEQTEQSLQIKVGDIEAKYHELCQKMANSAVPVESFAHSIELEQQVKELQVKVTSEEMRANQNEQKVHLVENNHAASLNRIRELEQKHAETFKLLGISKENERIAENQVHEYKAKLAEAEKRLAEEKNVDAKPVVVETTRTRDLEHRLMQLDMTRKEGIESLKQDFAEKENEYVDEINLLSEQLHQEEQKLAAIQKQHDVALLEMQHQNKELELYLSDRDATIVSQNQTIARKEEEIAKHAREVAYLKEKAAELEEYEASLHAIIEDKTEEITQFNDKLNSMHQQYDLLKLNYEEQSDTISAQLQDRDGTIARLGLEKHKLEDELREHADNLHNQLTEEKQRVQRQLEQSYLSQITELQQQILESKQKLAKHKTTKKQLEFQVDAKDKSIERLKSDTLAAKQENEQLKSALEQKDQNIALLKQQLDYMKNQQAKQQQ